MEGTAAGFSARYRCPGFRTCGITLSTACSATLNFNTVRKSSFLFFVFLSIFSKLYTVQADIIKYHASGCCMKIKVSQE